MEREQMPREMAALSDIAPRFDAARVERALGAVHTRLKVQRRVRATAFGVASALTVVALVAWFTLAQRPEPSGPTAQKTAVARAQAKAEPRVVHLKDGSLARLDD